MLTQAGRRMFKNVSIDAVVSLDPSLDPLLHQSLDEPLDGARASALQGLRTVEGQRHGGWRWRAG
jgi:hypothetical protein